MDNHKHALFDANSLSFDFTSHILPLSPIYTNVSFSPSNKIPPVARFYLAGWRNGLSRFTHQSGTPHDAVRERGPTPVKLDFPDVPEESSSVVGSVL